MASQNKSTKTHGEIRLPWIVKIFILGISAYIFFLRHCHRIKVRGVNNIKSTSWENRLILFNHPSFLETVLIPMTGFMPGMLTKPATRFPWSVANERTILNSRFKFFRNLPIVLLKTDEKGRPIDSMAFLREVLPKMKETTFLIAPEGTRSFHADEPRIVTPSGILMGQARNGIGFLVWHAKPTVIPVFVKGMERVMPPDKPAWRCIFKIWRHPVEIVFGEPIDFSSFFEKRRSREVYTEIGKTIMTAIAALDAKKPNGGTR